MKHLLLGTTALVAAGFMVGEAYAADPIKLGIGGYARGAGGVVLGDDDSLGESGAGRTNGRFRWDAEVHFKGETTLDNGITVGARIELEGQNAGDQIDEAFVDFSGGFGEVRFGQFNEAALQFCVGDPGNVTANFGANSPNEAFSNEGVNGLAPVTSLGTCYGVVGDDLNLTYFSPVFGGFQFGVSYQPNAPDQDTGPGGGTFAKGTPAQRDIFSAGATFSRDFDNVSLLVGGGASFVGKDDSDPNEATFYQAGFQVGFGGFSVGAAGSVGNDYQDSWGSTTPTGLVVATNSDYWTAQVGGSYTFEAWSVGLEWTHGEFEIASSSDEDTVDHIALTGSYALGPGIAIEGAASYVDYNDDDNVENAEYNAFTLATGFAISF
ncbi:MAG: porin [Dongiaceae bacterium]